MKEASLFDVLPEKVSTERRCDDSNAIRRSRDLVSFAVGLLLDPPRSWPSALGSRKASGIVAAGGEVLVTTRPIVKQFPQRRPPRRRPRRQGQAPSKSCTSRPHAN